MGVSAVIWVQNGSEEYQWDYVLSNLQVDKVYMMGPYQGTNNILREAPHIHNLSELPNEPIILMAPKSMRAFTPTISICDFKHPKDAIYVFGPNNEHFTEEDLGGRTINDIVHIPTDTTDEMFNYSAYLLTMWERRKTWPTK